MRNHVPDQSLSIPIAEEALAPFFSFFFLLNLHLDLDCSDDVVGVGLAMKRSSPTSLAMGFEVCVTLLFGVVRVSSCGKLAEGIVVVVGVVVVLCRFQGSSSLVESGEKSSYSFAPRVEKVYTH